MLQEVQPVGSLKKRAYSSPAVKRWGTVADLTRFGGFPPCDPISATASDTSDRYRKYRFRIIIRK